MGGGARCAARVATVEVLRDALHATDIRLVLSRPDTRAATAVQFDAWHRQWCSSICAKLNLGSVKNVAYGRAAKLVAVYLKVLITMGEAWDSPLGRTIHPPIDRILLQALASSTTIKSDHKRSSRSISWTRLDQAPYYDLIDQLSAVIPAGAPFWTIEEYWQPSDSANGEI